jgi:hypothetical protein
MSEICGVFQGDLIIRSALVEGIADLRRHPELIKFIFASLAQDELTKAVYGQKEIDQAAKWFRATDFPVFMSTRLDKPKFPCVSISLVESSEADNTLSDTHYQPQEDNADEWPALTNRFSPTSYTSSTGVMVIPDAVTAELILATGMVVIDDFGVSHIIQDVYDRSTIVLPIGTVASFTHAVIKGAPPSRIITLESCTMTESYQIGCHVQGEAVYLTYLHSIISFILLRYRETLLEARGFECSSINSADFRRNDYFESENVFSRHIVLKGKVRQTWPKLITSKITGVASVPVFSAVGDEVSAPEPVIDVDSEDAWLLESDGIGIKP